MNQETIIDAVGYMDFRGERLRTRDINGAWVSAPVRLKWFNEMEEVTSWMDDIYDRLPSRVPTASIATLKCRDVRVRQLDVPVWGPQRWEPYRFEYESDQGWVFSEGECALTSVDERCGTEWRIRPDVYMDRGMIFRKRDVMKP